MLMTQTQRMQRLWARIVLAFEDLNAYSEAAAAAAFADTAFALTRFFAQNPQHSSTIAHRIIRFAGLCDEPSQVTRDSESVSAAVKAEVKPNVKRDSHNANKFVL